MKYLNYLLALSLAGIVIGCNKNKIDSQANQLASLILTNAIVGGSSLKFNSNEKDTTKLYTATTYGIGSENSEIKVYSTTDPTTPVFHNVEVRNSGGIYSLFLTGTVSKIEAIYTQEELLAFHSDSSVAIRIINLSPNSTPINITLASASGISLFESIPFKEITNFIKIKLPLTVPANTVTFEARNSSTRELLGIYTLPPLANSTYPNISIRNSRNRNLTLVIKGLMGTTMGADAFGIFPVANY